MWHVRHSAYSFYIAEMSKKGLPEGRRTAKVEYTSNCFLQACWDIPVNVPLKSFNQIHN